MLIDQFQTKLSNYDKYKQEIETEWENYYIGKNRWDYYILKKNPEDVRIPWAFSNLIELDNPVPLKSILELKKYLLGKNGLHKRDTNYWLQELEKEINDIKEIVNEVIFKLTF